MHSALYLGWCANRKKPVARECPAEWQEFGSAASYGLAGTQSPREDHPQLARVEPKDSIASEKLKCVSGHYLYCSESLGCDVTQT